MKKLLYFFMSIVLAFNSTAFAAEGDTKESPSQMREYGILKSLGIIPEETENEGIVTRGEFAYMLYKILHTGEKDGVSDIWENTFWGEKNEDIIESENTVSFFSDLSESTEYLDEINFVSSKGLVHGQNSSGKGLIEGVNERFFAPDNTITVAEAARAFVLILGYDPIIEGITDAPENYCKIAQTIGIINNGANVNATCSYADAVQMIFAAMNTKILKVNYETGVKRGYVTGDTMMREIMKIDKMSGTLTDNGITAIDGPSRINNKYFKVGNTIFENKTEKSMYGLIGYNTEVYFSIATETENEAYSVTATGKNSIIEISADDFEKFENDRIYYGKRKQCPLNKPFFVIKNGEMKADWTADDFEFENGKIILIDSGEWYKTVVIKDYESRVVSVVDKKNHIIYSKNHAEDAELNEFSLDLTDYIENENIEIINADNSEAAFDDISENSVIDIMKSDKYISIIIGSNTIENFCINSFGIDDEGSAKIKDNQTEYIVPASYFYNGGTNFVVGEKYKLYLNSFGKVISAEYTADDAYKTGWLYESKYVDDDDNYMIFRIFNDNGEFVKLISAEKVRLNLSSDETINLKAAKLNERINGNTGLIRYKTDNENHLAEIEFASEGAKNGEFLQLICDASDGVVYRDEGLKYCSFDFKFYISDDTKIFIVPSSEQYKGNSDYYSMSKKSAMFVANAMYNVKAYSLKKGAKYAEYLVCEQDNRVQQTFGYARSDMIFLTVESISEGLNDDDEMCTVITGWKHGANINFEYTALYCDAKLCENGIAATDAATDTLRSGKKYKVKKGDIIRYLADSSGKYITKAEILYRTFAQNPVNSNGTMGALAGSVGYYDETPTIVNGMRYDFNPFSNPYAVTSAGYESGDNSINGDMYVFDGFAYKDENSILTMTTSDLSVNAYSDTNRKYKQICRYLNTSTYSMTTITRTEKEITAQKGTYGDIRTYEKYGGDCSRMVVVCRNGFPVQVFVINEK